MLIQIIACRCTERKLREAGARFYMETKFYPEIKDVFVVPGERHPLCKGKFSNTGIEMSCKCLLQGTRRCTNCKTKYFTLNFVANKLKLLPESVPDSIKLKSIDQYLKKDINSMLFWHF